MDLEPVPPDGRAGVARPCVRWVARLGNGVQPRHNLRRTKNAVGIREADIDVEILVWLAARAVAGETSEVQPGTSGILEIGRRRLSGVRVDMPWHELRRLPAQIVVRISAPGEVEIALLQNFLRTVRAVALEVDDVAARRYVWHARVVEGRNRWAIGVEALNVQDVDGLRHPPWGRKVNPLGNIDLGHTCE